MKRVSNLLGAVLRHPRSLKSTLALYFIPISVLPILTLSFYAMRVFEEASQENLRQRAFSERDAIVGEIDSLENNLLSQLRLRAGDARLAQVIAGSESRRIPELFSSVPPRISVRLYNPDGKYLGGRTEIASVNYISKEGLRRVRAGGETLERYLGQKGFVTIARTLIKDSRKVHGILEYDLPFDYAEMSELKNRRQVDVAFLSRDFQQMSASFALSNETLAAFSDKALKESVKPDRRPIFFELGDNRYAAYLFDFPANGGKVRYWGYLSVFMSLTHLEETLGKLKTALVYITVLFVLLAALAIFVLSNRLVKPIVALVSAMKRAKLGRVEQIPTLDSAYEIEYLVRSFNDMIRNVDAAKRALEIKLQELRQANQEIREAQSTVVQSAKLASLGQIVAGVAHELNNPIAFIYSNMHHLSDYRDRIEKLVEAYRKLTALVPEQSRDSVQALEKSLEIDYILSDMKDLISSCLDGANRTKDIVLGLRTFSRMDESTFKMVDVHEGLRSTIRLLRSELKDRITLHEHFGAIPQVEANPSQLNQVFMNLLTNAVHAISRNGDIWIRTRQEGEFVRIDIEDSGVGIPQEAMEKIFDPFFTTKKVGEGTGLGLSIAYGLIQKHHGKIEVQSKPSQGTCFSIVLPLKQPATALAG